MESVNSGEIIVSVYLVELFLCDWSSFCHRVLLVFIWLFKKWTQKPINIQNMATKTKDVLINEYPSVSRQQSAAPYQFPIIKQESKKLNKIAETS